MRFFSVLKNKKLGIYFIVAGLIFIAVAGLALYNDSKLNSDLSPDIIQVQGTDFQNDVLPGMHPVRTPLSPYHDAESGDVRTSVIELFMYTCPHCHTLSEPVLQWKRELASDIHVEIVPVVFNQSDMDYIRLHYALLEMGVPLESVLKGIFSAVHEERIKLRNTEDFAQLGSTLSGETVMAVQVAMSSEIINQKADLATMQFYKSGSRGVPTFVVDGVSRLDMADYGTLDEVFAVLSRATDEVN